MKAMYVHQLSRQGVPYADAIVQAYKSIETRSRNMLKALVGERVAVVRTVSGKVPVVVGYVTVVAASFCPATDFDKYFNQHLVPSGSVYDCRGKGKWFYHLANAETCEPFQVPASAIKHGRSWCEF